MRVSLIAAVTANGVIGRDNDLPWRLPKDMKRFKALTLGHTLVMGRKTWDSIGGRPLRGRRNVVITRRTDWHPEGAEVVHSLDEALTLAAAAGDDEVFIAGGGEIYRDALPRADRIHRTWIDTEIAGDTRFPEIDPKDWKIVEEEHHEPDADHAFPFTFQVLDRETQHD